ncbi:MAG: 50S ribosomal protein L4, partial [Atopobiaceae bacterium]|nr:50S ribosomal protein L4 [Atopobiaceae bacterium]
MANYEIKKIDGTNAGSVELADAVYGIEPNIPVIHQVVVCQDACLRQGTHATKNRHAVSGGGKKPYRQKGTGRARQGSTRAGQWTGGGVIFGPMPHSHAKRINNKMVKLAMRSVLSGKVADQ